MARVSKTERLLNLVSYLLKERRPVPWRNIVGRVVGYDDGSDPKSLERRFERDKAALKEMGIPIQYHPPGVYETEGYTIPRDAAFLDEAELTPREVSLLNLISELALRNTTAFRAELVSALRKLSFDVELTEIAEGRRTVPGKGKRRQKTRGRSARGRRARSGAEDSEDAQKRAVLHLDMLGALRAEEQLPALVAAVHTSTTVRFDYQSAGRDVPKTRTIDPYGLGYARGSWYLVGREHASGEIKTFNLRRLVGAVSRVGEPHAFRVPEGFRLDDYLEKPPWQFAGSPPERVVIEADADIGWFLQGPIAKREMEVRPDGSVVMVFDVRRRDAFINWVMPKLRHIRILEPASLREELKEAVDRLIERHRSPSAALAAGGGATRERRRGE